jgi:hypothetical protein
MPKPKVLLADDNFDMREYIARLLASKYEVISVSNGSLYPCHPFTTYADSILVPFLPCRLGSAERSTGAFAGCGPGVDRHHDALPRRLRLDQGDQVQDLNARTVPPHHFSLLLTLIIYIY